MMRKECAGEDADWGQPVDEMIEDRRRYAEVKRRVLERLGFQGARIVDASAFD